MKIKKYIGGELESNGYVIYHRNGGECYIIDPGYNADKFIKFIKEERLKLKGILLTHHHYDHTDDVQKLKDIKECEAFMHIDDLDMYRGEIEHGLVSDEVLLLDDEEIDVVHTPGHTRGSVCFYAKDSKVIFTGDTIFADDIGRTDLKDGDDHVMHRTCHELDLLLDNEVTVYPGHGDSATMKFVRKFNAEFGEYSRGK